MRTFKLLMAAGILTSCSLASAHPGMLNYVEGQASIDGRPVTNQSVGNADVRQGQVIETSQGKAEILLTPGVFLRLGDHSAVRMVNPGLVNTQVELLRGEALVEATDIYKGNHIQILNHGVTTTLDKNGLYSFHADQPQVAVYAGEATLSNGDSHQDLKKGREEDLAGNHVTKFDTKQGDELYRWSDVRSQYLSEASVASAKTFLVEPVGWYGTGWYWNPWYGFYSFIPANGLFYSPFGYGFYGPRYAAYYRGALRGGYVAAARPAFAGHAAFAGRVRGGRR
jgi:hypothetical protein